MIPGSLESNKNEFWRGGGKIVKIGNFLFICHFYEKEINSVFRTSAKVLISTEDMKGKIKL